MAKKLAKTLCGLTVVMVAVGGVLAYLKMRDGKDSLDEDFDDFTDLTQSALTQHFPKNRKRRNRKQKSRPIPATEKKRFPLILTVRFPAKPPGNNFLQSAAER